MAGQASWSSYSCKEDEEGERRASQRSRGDAWGKAVGALPSAGEEDSRLAWPT